VELAFILSKSISVLIDIAFKGININQLIILKHEFFDIISIIFILGAGITGISIVFKQANIEKGALSNLIVTILQAFVHEE